MGNVNNTYQNEAISGLKEAFASILPDGYSGLADASSLSSLGPDALLGMILGTLSERRGEVVSFFLLLFGFGILLSLCETLLGSMRGVASGGVSAAVSFGIFAAVYPLALDVSEALLGMGEFFSALVPILSSFLALGGSAGTAASASVGLGVSAWLTGLVSEKLLLPIITAIFASAAVSSSLGGASLRISGVLRRSFSRAIGVVGAITAALFALQTYVTVAADSVSMRAAKYAAGGMIPVVGGTVSGAVSTLAGGLSSLGSIIGASSVAVILIVALSPLVLLLLYRLAFSLCALFCEASGGTPGCISAFASAFDALISVYVMTTIIYIFEIIILIWGGNSVLGTW